MCQSWDLSQAKPYTCSVMWNWFMELTTELDSLEENGVGKSPQNQTWFNKQQVTVQFINYRGGSNTCKGIDLEDANADICRHLRMLWTLIYKCLHMPSKDEDLPKGSSCRNEHYKPCDKRIPGNERVALSVPPLSRKRKDLPFRTL